MKLLTKGLVILTSCILLYSCGEKKVEVKEKYVNPAFLENLTDAYETVNKRFSLDFKDLKKRFGEPAKIAIDSVIGQTINERDIYDSTYTFTYKNQIFHYQKRTYDQKYFLTEIDINGDFRAKQFTLQMNEPKDEFLSYFGDPSITTVKDNREELTYALYKDEEGVYYDSFVFIFVDGKYTGLKYIPYLEIYPEEQEQQQNNQQTEQQEIIQ